MTKISHNRVLITDPDRLAIDNVLTSGWIAEGKVVKDLEGDFVNCLGGGKACAVSSGTAALFLALRGLGIGRGDHVAVPSYSCAALLNAIYMLDAEPLVVDVRLDDFTINVENLLTDYGHIRACIAVHCFGASADVSALCERGILTVEDCCQSLGGPQGLIGDVAVFSFYATKIITGGQGGLLWDETGKVAESARDFREYDGRKSYFPRFNFQMTDIQASIGRVQLKQLPFFLCIFVFQLATSINFWRYVLTDSPGETDINTISNRKRAIIIGAGRAADMLIREILRDGNYIPIGLLDDNSQLKKSEIHGIKVLDVIDNVVDICDKKDICFVSVLSLLVNIIGLFI